MRIAAFLIFGVCTSGLFGVSNASDQPVKQDSNAAASSSAETQQERDARMQWWREARFGMFVHWGLYSGLAGTWDGKPVGTTGGMEWIQQRVKVDTEPDRIATVVVLDIEGSP